VAAGAAGAVTTGAVDPSAGTRAATDDVAVVSPPFADIVAGVWDVTGVGAGTGVGGAASETVATDDDEDDAGAAVDAAVAGETGSMAGCGGDVAPDEDDVGAWVAGSRDAACRVSVPGDAGAGCVTVAGAVVAIASLAGATTLPAPFPPPDRSQATYPPAVTMTTISTAIRTPDRFTTIPFSGAVFLGAEPCFLHTMSRLS